MISVAGGLVREVLPLEALLRFCRIERLTLTNERAIAALNENAAVQSVDLDPGLLIKCDSCPSADFGLGSDYLFQLKPAVGPPMKKGNEIRGKSNTPRVANNIDSCRPNVLTISACVVLNRPAAIAY